MRQAIITKFLGPNNTRGARIKASADAGSVTINWSHGLDIETNHAAAANALVLKLGWKGDWRGGSLPGSGYVFVDISE